MAYATAILGLTQVAAGIMASRESRDKAALSANQAAMVEQKKGVVAYQYSRAKRKMVGEVTAKTAGAGVGLSGSPMAVMLDNLTQMEYDQSIEQYNLDREKSYYEAEAKMYKKQAKTNLWKGLLTGGATFASMYKPQTTTQNTNWSGAGFKSGTEIQQWGFK